MDVDGEAGPSEPADQDMLPSDEAADDAELDEGFYDEDEEAPGQATPMRHGDGSRHLAPTPLRTPKTPFKTPGRAPPAKTPRTIQQSLKKKKKKSRKSHLDISALTNEQVALAALESNQLLHLKLRKRYYAEALSFIRQIESSMDIIGKLLGSTNKAEVLESIEFFRVTHEYQFEGAEPGIKKMLHLVWSKDNSSTTEDGKELKGIRSRLLECYRNLYFDALPDMEPKQQVNRIAKNMIE